MGGGVHINDEQLLAVKDDVTTLAVSIGEIADGAYVTQTMFTKAQADSTGALDELLHTLVSAANAMQDCAQGLVNYLDKIYVDYGATDVALAEHANLALEPTDQPK